MAEPRTTRWQATCPTCSTSYVFEDVENWFPAGCFGVAAMLWEMERGHR